MGRPPPVQDSRSIAVEVVTVGSHSIPTSPRSFCDLATASGSWNIDRLNRERTQAVAAFGFTERQARFLVEVMIHSGVFLARQYCSFANIAHGQKTHDFLRKLVERGYAHPIQVGLLHRGRLFHLRHKPLYAAIGEADNRHRKRMALGRMVERLMVLDAVLADRTFTWLGTEKDKRAYFVRTLQGPFEPPEFPRISFGVDETRTVRYFPDKLPIGIQADRIDHVFVYLLTGPVPADFRVFLLRHAELLRALTRWTLRVLVPQPFGKSIPVFGQAAREELASPIAPSIAEELQWFFRERQRRQRSPSTPMDERFWTAASAFRAPRFRVLYRLWEQEGDPVIWAAQSGVLKDALERKQARVEFVQLSQQYLHLSSLVGVA